jgi:hypothetical protein
MIVFENKETFEEIKLSEYRKGIESKNKFDFTFSDNFEDYLKNLKIRKNRNKLKIKEFYEYLHSRGVYDKLGFEIFLGCCVTNRERGREFEQFVKNWIS